MTGCAFAELLCLVDQTEKFTVFFDFHDVVEDAVDFAVGRTVDASDIEVDDLNDVSMFGLVAHLDLVEESLEDLLLIAAFAVGLADLLVHDLDGNTLVGQHIHRHLDSTSTHAYLLKRPRPNLNITRYFSSITGHWSRYSCGSSRIKFICIINFGIKFVII